MGCRIEYLVSSKVPVHKTPIDYRRKMSNFPWEKPGRHLWNLINNETNRNVCAWKEARKDHDISPVIGLPKMYTLSLIMRKQTNKWRAHNYWPVMFKSVKINQSTERLKHCFRPKNTKCNVWWWAVSLAAKYVIETIGKTWMDLNFRWQ